MGKPKALLEKLPEREVLVTTEDEVVIRFNTKAVRDTNYGTVLYDTRLNQTWEQRCTEERVQRYRMYAHYAAPINVSKHGKVNFKTHHRLNYVEERDEHKRVVKKTVNEDDPIHILCNAERFNKLVQRIRVRL
jgi:hypothetical protein